MRTGWAECAIRVNIITVPVCLKLVKEFLLVRMHNGISLIVQFSLHIILVVQTKVPLLCLMCGSACIVCLHVHERLFLKKISAMYSSLFISIKIIFLLLDVEHHCFRTANVCSYTVNLYI